MNDFPCCAPNTAATDALNDALTRLSRNDEQPTRTAHVPVTWAVAARLAGCVIDSVWEWRREDAPTDYCRTHGYYANQPVPRAGARVHRPQPHRRRERDDQGGLMTNLTPKQQAELHRKAADAFDDLAEIFEALMGVRLNAYVHAAEDQRGYADTLDPPTTAQPAWQGAKRAEVNE